MVSRSRRRTRSAVVAASIVVLAVAVPARSGGAVAPAAGRCTIVGTEAADTLVGTSGNDVICALGGNDTVSALGGNDIVRGGPGIDTVSGGPGRDIVYGGTGRDALTGGLGADQLVGGADPDRLTVTVGDTCLLGGGDTVTGTCAPDTVPPVISAVTVPTPTSAGGDLVVTWRVVDASGAFAATGGPATWLFIGGSSGWVTGWCGFPAVGVLVDGTRYDGRYRVTCPVPSTAVNGEYTLFLRAVDAFGNATSDSVEVPVEIVGGSTDDQAPVVSEIEVAAPSYGAGDDVTVRWRATDATGVGYVIPWVFGPDGFLVDTSGRLWVSAAPGELVAGDERDGRYSVTLRLSDTAEPGTYRIWTSRSDVLGNRVFDASPAEFTVTG